MRNSIEQEFIYFFVFIKLKYKRLKVITILVKENFSKIRLIALQESMKSISNV